LAVHLSTGGEAYTGPWNFGPETDSNRSVRQLVERVVAVWGGGEVNFAQNRRGQPHEASLLSLNCDKAKHRLKWRPLWDFDQTVEETIMWYRQVDGGGDAWEVTREQITRYMDLSRSSLERSSREHA
jgi:CDP-glucose 4,6-dehydratase